MCLRTILIGTVVLLGTACGSVSSSPTPTPTTAPSLESSQIITLGDIDPDEPGKKIRRFQPLADHLAEQLREFDIREEGSSSPATSRR